MKLSDELFNDVCQTLGAGGEADGATSTAPTQRRSARRRVGKPVDVEPTSVSPAPRSVLLFDLSPGGACLIDDRTSAPGEKLTLRLPVAGGRAVPVMCVVQNCRLTRDGRFRVGVEFLGRAEAETRGPTFARGARGLRPINLPPMYSADAEPAADPDDGDCDSDGLPANNSAGDRRTGRDRRAPRRPTTGRAQLQTYDADGTAGRIIEANVHDFSDTGAGLTCDGPLPVGQRFVGRVHVRGHEPATHLYTVASCRPLDDGTFRVGAKRISWTGRSAKSAGARGLQRLLYWLR
jgi:hypothetical protein